VGTNRKENKNTKSVGRLPSDDNIYLNEKQVLERVIGIKRTLFRKWVRLGHIRKFKPRDSRTCLYNWGEIKRWIESSWANKSPFLGEPLTKLKMSA